MNFLIEIEFRPSEGLVKAQVSQSPALHCGGTCLSRANPWEFHGGHSVARGRVFLRVLALFFVIVIPHILHTRLRL